QRGFTARAAHRNQAIVPERPAIVQELECLNESRHRFHAGNAVAVEKSVIEGVGAGKRGGVAHRDLGSLLGAPGLERYHRLAVLARLLGGTGEGSDISEAFHVEANGGDALVLSERFEHARHVDIGLVADGKNRGDWKSAPRHREVAADIPGLGDYGDASFDRLKSVLIGP